MKGNELQNFVRHGKEKAQFPLFFYKGALHSLWIDFELSSKKFNGELSSSSSSVFVKWTELELTTEFMEKTEFNWELKIQFWTAIQLWLYLQCWKKCISTEGSYKQYLEVVAK